MEPGGSSTPAGDNRYARRHSSLPPDNRSPAERDRDRILYNSAFRRLAGVTQVVTPEEGDIFHNRLTHSLKVAQFGRRLAEKLVRDYTPDQIASFGGIDPDVVEAACLAHDIGHPPFGHVAEEELQRLSEEIGSFEGNAQSFRVVSSLGRHSAWDDTRAVPKYLGLDLTRATLNAILKYPWRRGENGAKSKKKWGCYLGESGDFEFARKLMPAESKKRCLEAELMNWSDDVTYSVHDMEDFYKAGLIPLDRIGRDDRVKKNFYDGAFSRVEGEPALAVNNGRFTRAELEQSFETILNIVPVEEPYSGTSEQRCRLRSLTSTLVGMYLRAVSLAATDGPRGPLSIDAVCEQQVIMGKELTWQFVILNPSLGAQQHGHRTIVSKLFEILHDAVLHNRLAVLPISAREALAGADSHDDRARTVVDLIAGMTEQQAIQMYQRLAGISLGSIFPVVPR